MSLEEKEEWKQINDWAVVAGKNLQSPQSGLVQLFYHSIPEDPQHTVPVYENVLFSLALMRSRLGDSVMEGKAILERMLAFQGSEGNFPIYIHEFPISRDRFFGAFLLPPFYWILVQFHTVLGSELKTRLDLVVKTLLDYTLKVSETFDIPPHLKCKIASSSIAFGKLWNDPTLIIRGQSLLDTIPKELNSPCWLDPSHLADLLISLQMIYPSLKGSPWEHLLPQLGRIWHEKLCSSYNPSLKELQNGFQPQSTLLDLWMGYYTRTFSQRSQKKNSFMLQGALIHSTTDHISKENYPLRIEGYVEGNRTLSIATEHLAYTVYQNSVPLHPSADRGRHPFRLIWGNSSHLHTFVLEGGNLTSVNYEEFETGVNLFIHLAEPFPDDDREKNKEIIFYSDMHEDLNLTVNGHTSTVFKLEEQITLKSKSVSLNLRYSLINGEGSFIGHLMRGNRPTQTAVKGMQKFTAFDQQLILRTLRRSHPCCIKISIEIINEM